MKVLIVYAYPNHQGLNAQILARVQAGLDARHEVKTLDLYLEHKEKGFDPCLVFDQDHKRRDLDKDPQMAPYRDLVTWADHLIFTSILFGGAACLLYSRALLIVFWLRALPTIIVIIQSLKPCLRAEPAVSLPPTIQ